MLYSWHQPIRVTPLTSPIATVCLSDNHNAQVSIPDADILLIHAGDLTQSGFLKEFQASLIGYVFSLIPSKSLSLVIMSVYSTQNAMIE
jgi:hypothetical protein